MQSQANQLLLHYLKEWDLKVGGESFFTHSSLLQPVISQGEKAMLKIPLESEERLGISLMAWWSGEGAVPILKYDKNALLMVRVESAHPTLTEMVKVDRDDEATQIICKVADQLHVAKSSSLTQFVSLEDWFSDLWPAAEKHGGVIATGARIAKKLLDNQQDICILHGDLHHGNVLHSDVYGWVVIDPKGLYGERTFDYANILCNPDKETALNPSRLQRQISVISKATGLDKKHLLEWTVAWTSLSATWFLNDGDDASLPLSLAEIALGEL